MFISFIYTFLIIFYFYKAKVIVPAPPDSKGVI